MTYTPDFTVLDGADIDDRAEIIAALIAEQYPQITMTKGGVFYDYVLRIQAGMDLIRQKELDDLAEQWNVSDILEATDVSSTILDKLASNWNVERSEGTEASGTVEVVISQLVTTTLQAGTVFTSGDLTFETPVSYTGVISSAEKLSDTDKVITERSDGNYSFIVNVTASEVGEDGNVAAGTAFEITPEPSYLVAAIAATNFSGGSDEESSQSLMTRMASGISAKVLSALPGAIASMETLIPTTTAVAVIGMRDAEMTRDQRSLFGTSNGGKVDMYVRTQPGLETLVLTKEATALGDNSYRISLTRDEVPGVIDLVSVNASGAASTDTLTIDSETWGYSLPDSGFVPDIQDAEEAAFSRYQTLTFDFTDPNDVGTYEVRMLQMPDIDTAQAYALSTQYRDPLADWLVKAPIPALVSVTMTVIRPSGVTVSTTEVQAAVVSAVNSQSFVDSLSASVIVQAAQAALPAGAYLSMPIEIIAEIVLPTRTSEYRRSGNMINVPDDAHDFVSGNTVAFFTDSQRVTVNEENL